MRALGPTQAKVLEIFKRAPYRWFYTWEILEEFPDDSTQNLRRVLRKLAKKLYLTKYDRSDQSPPYYSRIAMWRLLDLPHYQERVFKVLYGRSG